MGQGEVSELRYDAAIIGAGAEGLAAATILARSGLSVIVIERGAAAGGRYATREFHPGYRASPFADDIAQIPAALFWTLDLARHGAVIAPPRHSLALWPDRHHLVSFGESGAVPLLAEADRRRQAVAARVLGAAKEAPQRSPFRSRNQESWPGEDWATMTLADVLATANLAPDAAAHLAALSLSGGVGDPFLHGSAIHLLHAGASGHHLSGGPAALAKALLGAARAAGVAFSFGLEASDIQRRDGRIVAVGLADGSEIAARSVVSTLDLKRTFLSFFSWNALPKLLVRRVNAFRMAGSTARVLFALEREPSLAASGAFYGPIHAAPDLARTREAFQAWRAGVLARELPVTFNFVTSRDPSLAPPAGAVVTATLGAVPFRLFDGAWTLEKRELLKARALDAAESVAPGFSALVVGAEVVAPPDIEDMLGATDGDLRGGEIAGDQMLGCGPWAEPALPRTPIAGLYLAGSHLTASAFASCVAGAAAAYALVADHARGKLK
jgi:phytoene dehydrogenase-like protein